MQVPLGKDSGDGDAALGGTDFTPRQIVAALRAMVLEDRGLKHRLALELLSWHSKEVSPMASSTAEGLLRALGEVTFDICVREAHTLDRLVEYLIHMGELDNVHANLPTAARAFVELCKARHGQAILGRMNRA